MSRIKSQALATASVTETELVAKPGTQTAGTSTPLTGIETVLSLISGEAAGSEPVVLEQPRKTKKFFLTSLLRYWNQDSAVTLTAALTQAASLIWLEGEHEMFDPMGILSMPFGNLFHDSGLFREV